MEGENQQDNTYQESLVVEENHAILAAIPGFVAGVSWDDFAPGVQGLSMLDSMDKDHQDFVLSAALWQVLNGPFGMNRPYTPPGSQVSYTLRQVVGDRLPRMAFFKVCEEIAKHLRDNFEKDALNDRLGPVQRTAGGPYPLYQNPNVKRQQTSQQRAAGWAKIGLGPDGVSPLNSRQQQPPQQQQPLQPPPVSTTTRRTVSPTATRPLTGLGSGQSQQTQPGFRPGMFGTRS